MDSKRREIYSKLDVRKILIAYLERTGESLLPYSFFTRGPTEANKPQSMIAWWIKLATHLAYWAQSLATSPPPPSGIKVHSTRAWASSLAERAGATAKQICRVATWSNFKSFCWALLNQPPDQSGSNLLVKKCYRLYSHPSIACYIHPDAALEEDWEKTELGTW